MTDDDPDNYFDTLEYNADGTIDDLAAESQWHLEDMGDWFYFGACFDDQTIQFRIYNEDGGVVVEPYDGQLTSDG